ncbi:hypothetical protein [Savagea faecisuis]|uniref:Uncharacterized protein n=1 Tax=Savagea faecisuis TaxID=1274803 RepID=A0ABW3GVZ8_9BACL
MESLLKSEYAKGTVSSPEGLFLPILPFCLVAILAFELYNKDKDMIRKGAVYMKELKLDSKEFKRVLHNLHLENLSLSLDMQKKVLDLVNAKVSITPTLIKDILGHGKV